MSDAQITGEKRQGRVLVAVATFNEMENLPTLVEAIATTCPDVEILVVDDNSPDGTGQWAAQRAQSDPRIHAIVRANERGLGTAVIAALRFALEFDYDYLVNMDADFSHPVDMIEKLIETTSSGTADVSIGSRYVTGGKIIGWSLKRRMMSRAINAFTRIMLGTRIRDNSGSFRCYRVETLRKLDLDSIVSRGYSFFEEILYRLGRQGARFAEVPITFTDRTRGASKINKKEAIVAIWTLMALGLGFRR